MEALFLAIRSACSPTTWSRGVQLARDGAVSEEMRSPEELRAQIAARGEIVSPTVTLYPEDEDWECDCASRADACEHVAAAVIALRRAERGDAPRAAPAPGRLRYQLTREGRGLAFEREIVAGDGSPHPLTTTLEAIARGRVDGPRFAATSADLEAELALGAKRRGRLDEATLRRLAEPLSRCEDVRLDGEPVKISAEPVRPVALLEDAPGGFRLSVGADDGVDENFDLGFVMCRNELRPVGASQLTGRELEDLTRGRFYPADRAPELLTQVLPSLRDRLELQVRTRELPRTVAGEAPRVQLEVSRSGDRLCVLPTLVYGDPPIARVDGGRLVPLQGPIPLRDEETERARVQQLRNQLGLAIGRRVEVGGTDAIELAQQIERWRGPVRGDAHRGFRPVAALEPQLHITGDRLELGFALPGAPEGKSDTSAEAVMRAWRAGESHIALSGGGMAPLPADWLARFGDRVADLLAARREDGVVPTHALPDLAALCEELEHPAPPGLERLEPLLGDFRELPRAPLSPALAQTLRDYQRAGVDWLCFLRDAGLGALLADDMGLGKTLQTLCALRGRSLVVAPTSVLHGWRAEIERFRPELRCCVYHGPARALDPDADVTLTTYAILRLDADALCAESWDCAVLDEAQNVKNPESQVAQVAYRLTADWRVALTGTPVENRLDELWSQLHFLNRGLLGGRSDFRERVAKPIAEGDAATTERLRTRLRPFLLRRLKRDVARELPPRSDVVLHCELDTEERRVYDAIRAATVPEVVRSLEAGGSVIAALEALLRLRQAACHAALVPGQQATRSTKLELLVERLSEACDEGHASLVFSQWTSLLDLAEPGLREAGIGFERLDGSTRDRAGVVERFQAGEAPVMLVSLRAGGTGLNLTAADHIFLLDPWWNPAVEDQAADRAHRIGQTRPVVVHRLIAQATVEERILELHTRKRALAEAALGGSDAGAGLRREDLLELFA